MKRDSIRLTGDAANEFVSAAIKAQSAQEPSARKIGQRDGFGGRKLEEFELTEAVNVVCCHSCLLPEFSITLRVAELRKLMAGLRDDDGLTVTVSAEQPAKLTYVR